MKKLLVLFLLASTASLSKAQKVDFKLNVPLNKTFKTVTVAKTDVDGEQSMIMDMNMKGEISSVSKEGANYTFESVTNAIKMDMDAGMMAISYDSENPSDDPMSQMLAAEMDKLVGKKTTMVISEKGKLIKLDMPEGVPAGQSNSFESMGVTANYPDEAVSPGDTWTSEVVNEQSKVKMTNKYIGKNENGYVIESTGEMFTPSDEKIGTITSTYTLDEKTHFTKATTMKMAMEMQGQKVNMNLNVTVVE